MSDVQYHTLPTTGSGIAHHYGPHIHILSNAYAMSLLSRLCEPATTQPQVNHLVSGLYDHLLGVVASHALRRTAIQTPTRMKEFTDKGIYSGQAIDRSQRVVVVDIARAGILPSHRIYEGMHHIIDAASIRQDHVVASRTTDRSGAVTGVTLDGSKIGGTVEDATVIFPDPMAATGSSLAGVIQHYRDSVPGRAHRMVAVHLIVTPEYLKRMSTQFPDLDIFAVRLDRGLSEPDVLDSIPGTYWDREVGLNETQYIVPGAGGVGEVLNNAWI